jgi:CrcB protein
VEPWVRVIALSAGGALGVNARYWLGSWMSRWASPQFPWATFTINVSGSFAIGLLTVVLARWSSHSHLRLLVLVGFLGGYTTFSTFALESLTLWERGEAGLAVANLVGSVAAAFVAVVLGAGLARGLMLPAPGRPAGAIGRLARRPAISIDDIRPCWSRTTAPTTHPGRLRSPVGAPSPATRGARRGSDRPDADRGPARPHRPGRRTVVGAARVLPRVKAPPG